MPNRKVTHPIIYDNAGEFRMPPHFSLDPSLAALTPNQILRCCRTAQRTPNGIKHLVVVNENEQRLFFELVYPLANNLAGGKRIILCDLLNPANNLGDSDFPIIMINAAKTTITELKSFLRYESTAAAFLNNPTNHVLIYFYNIGETHKSEKLANLITGLLDGGIRSAKTTHVVMTGVYNKTGKTGIRNFIDAGGVSRCRVCGVE